MSRFKKLINIIYYLISIILLLALLLMLNSKSYLAHRILDVIASNEIFIMALGVLGAIVLLVLLLKLIGSILQKTDEKYLYLFEDDGDVCISDTAIEKTVKNALREFEEVIEYTVKIKIKNKEEDSKVRVEDDGDVCISDTAIEKTVKNALREFEEVIEYTVKIKIKNKEEDSKVRVKIKCGLDENICKAKGYYDYIMDNEKLKNSTETEKVVNLVENPVDKKTEVEISNSNKPVENIDSNQTFKKDMDLPKKEENLAPEIIDAMNVISGEGVENKNQLENNSDKKVILSNNIEVEEKNKEKVQLVSSEEKSNVIKENTEVSEANKLKEISKMSIDDLCSTIQLYIHDTMQEFLSQRVDKVDIKFYDVKVKEKIHNKKSEKNESKNKQKKMNKKKKRVN